MSAENETIADIAAKSRSVDDFIDTICRRVKIRKPSKSSYWAVVVEYMYNEIRHLAGRNQPGNAAKLREALCGARAMAVGFVNCGGGEPWNRLVEEIDAALAAKPRVCDVYAPKDLKMIVYSEMGRHCMEGRLSKDCLEITKAVADSVIDGITAEMKDDGEERK